MAKSPIILTAPASALGATGRDATKRLVSVLERWAASGGHWEVLVQREEWIEVALVSCDGEQMSRVSSPRTSVLRSFLDARTGD